MTIAVSLFASDHGTSGIGRYMIDMMSELLDAGQEYTWHIWVAEEDIKVFPFLARTSHQLPAAASDAPHPAAFSRIGMLDGLSSTTPRPSGRKHRWARRLPALATKPAEKYGLEPDGPGNVRLHAVPDRWNGPVPSLLWHALILPRLIRRVGAGGLFDFYSGRIARAPMWMREFGFEWVWRLLQEPGRMWRRYVIGNPLFLWRVWKTRHHTIGTASKPLPRGGNHVYN